MLVKTVTCKLRVTEETAAALAETMALFNAVCNRLSQIAWETKTFRAYELHRIAYHQMRAEFRLPAQLTVRALAKVADSYKTDRSIQHVFGPRGAVVFDARCFTLENLSSVSLTTTRGRRRFVMAHGGKQREQLKAGATGEADLLYRDGSYYLAVSVKATEPPKRETPGGILGVDLGIVEIATDSDGHSYSGAAVKSVRRRVRRLRRLLQAKGTRSAERHLKKIKRKQSRFVRDTNHCIAKTLVATAVSRQKALALEELTGTGSEATARPTTWVPAGRCAGSWATGPLPTSGPRSTTRPPKPVSR